MRRITRTKINKNKKDRLYTIVAFFIAAPIISILLGFFLVQYVILPRLSEGENTLNPIEHRVEENKETEADDISNDSVYEDDLNNQIGDTEESSDNTDLVDSLPNTGDEEQREVTFYSVQLGNFSSITNAESFIKELKENNIDGFIISNGTFKVFTGEFNSRDDAYKHLEGIKPIYEDAFVNLVSKKQ
ncbi:Sporulation related domain-containing protein [Proteiniborus ethanoligenes]|uniref:Sporulation related domain-containing protein n=1 Tax=Proteiniborus ethanoligenes TaxID=415015 RepID=A0A1H3S2D5_9FIRM|nr:SPOR domain-containing protein [Proteiniborus ethanoligenes]SDZ32223.1 Sporulation related domain-containing protein [Proteiniborus ethanoligenes]